MANGVSGILRVGMGGLLLTAAPAVGSRALVGCARRSATLLMGYIEKDALPDCDSQAAPLAKSVGEWQGLHAVPPHLTTQHRNGQGAR